MLTLSCVHTMHQSSDVPLLGMPVLAAALGSQYLSFSIPGNYLSALEQEKFPDATFESVVPGD